MRSTLVGLVLLAALVGGCASEAPPSVLDVRARFGQPESLPALVDNDMPLSDALNNRRSVREFSAEPLGIDLIGQLFWAAQGVTDNRGYRTAPSAGAHYPLEIYAVTSNEVLHYVPDDHRFEARPDTRTLGELGAAAFGQSFLSDAPAVFVISAVASRTEVEYGAVTPELINRESGHAAQNLLLQATALDLAAVPVGGFNSDAVADLLAFSVGEEPLYLIPAGRHP